MDSTRFPALLGGLAGVGDRLLGGNAGHRAEACPLLFFLGRMRPIIIVKPSELTALYPEHTFKAA